MYFVDLRAIPRHARPMTMDQFAVLMAHLLHSEYLDGLKIREVIKDPKFGKIIGVLNKFGTYTPEKWVNGGPEKTVKDLNGVLHALKIISIESYLMVSIGKPLFCLQMIILISSKQISIRTLT